MKCPVATRDITINMQNRGRAIDKADYGPMNPDEPNEMYWRRMAARWDATPKEAKTMRCGNCAAFNKTGDMLVCISRGISQDASEDAMDVIDAGDMGFCEIFDFKCAGSRTCSAWSEGGPITDEEEDDDYDDNDDADYEYDGQDEGEYDEEDSDMRPGEG